LDAKESNVKIKIWTGEVDEITLKRRFRLAYKLAKEKQGAGAPDVIFEEIDAPAPEGTSGVEVVG